MTKSQKVHLYQAQIKEICSKYENEEDRRCLRFHNYGSG